MQIGTLVHYFGNVCWEEDFGIVMSNGCDGDCSIYWIVEGGVCHYSAEEFKEVFENSVEVLCE